MKLAAGAVLSFLILQIPVPGTQQSQVPTGSMEGIVLRADTGDPVAKAQVLLTRTIPPPAPVDYYVKEARIEQTDVLDDPWVITGLVRGSLSVVVSSTAGQIDGTVTDTRLQGVSALTTVLIPDQHRYRSDLFRTTVTDQSGKFTLRGIAPGAYKLFAWEALEPNAFFDPQILRQYEDQGKAVRVAESGKVTAKVKMIPAK